MDTNRLIAIGYSQRYDRRKRASWYLLIGSLLLINVLLAACWQSGNQNTGDNGSQNTTPIGYPFANQVELTQLSWCNGQPAQIFMDNRAASVPTPVEGQLAEPVNLGPANGTPVPIEKWDILKANLGFVVFLPEVLPRDSCLLSASGAVRDAIRGSYFTLTYMLPNQQSLTISQAPQYTSHRDLTCSASEASNQNQESTDEGTPVATPTATPRPLQICSGLLDTTNITFSARWDVADLEQFFADFKPDIVWQPAA